MGQFHVGYIIPCNLRENNTQIQVLAYQKQASDTFKNDYYNQK